MMYYFNSILLQASVVGDLRTENGGESMWGFPLTAIIGFAIIYFFSKNVK